MNIIEANVATPDARVAITIARFNNFINDSLRMSCRWRLAHWRKPVNMTR